MNSELENKVNYLYDSVKAEHISTKELYHGHFIDLIEEQYLLPNNKIIKRERRVVRRQTLRERTDRRVLLVRNCSDEKR